MKKLETARSLAAVFGIAALSTFGSTGTAHDCGPMPAPGDVPINTTCDGASVVNVGIGSPVSVTGNNAGALVDPALGVRVVWEGFTTNTCTDLTISYCGTAPRFSAALTKLAVGCPLTNLVHNSSANIIPNVCGDTNVGIRFPGLPAGTYYYPVLEVTGASGDYTLVFTALACAGTPPANALCDGATPIEAGTECTYVNGSVALATVAGVTGNGCNDSDIADGVWFSFVATETAARVRVTPSDDFEAQVEVFEGNCNSLVLLNCASAFQPGLAVQTVVSDLTVGQTYYVRVADWFAGTPITTGFSICVVGFAGNNCLAEAGTLTANTPLICYTGGTVNVNASWNDYTVPSGYQGIFLLTTGPNDVIVQGAFTPAFNVTAAGVFTIHALVYNSATLNLGTLIFGQSQLSDLNAQLIQGGGSICASLDLVGASGWVTPCPPPCQAVAGTLIADAQSVCLENGAATISASPGTSTVEPSGFQTVFILTNQAQVIQATSSAPVFILDQAGVYSMHTLVHNPATLDLASIEFGVTTAAEVDALLEQGGGSICGSLELSGAQFTVEDCLPPCSTDAGTLEADAGFVCLVDGQATVSATQTGAPVVPEGFATVYVLTSSLDQIVEGTSITPEFLVSMAHNYTIHTLVYDPATLDLGSIVPGETTSAEMEDLLIQGGGTICGSLDMDGAAFIVDVCLPPCEALAGTLLAAEDTLCFSGTPLTISAGHGEGPVAPLGYDTLYVLSEGPGHVIQALAATPEFVVDTTALYTIHTLIHDPLTLDVGTIIPGETTAGEVNAWLIQGGGVVCGSLDTTGAGVLVRYCCDSRAGTSTPVDVSVCLMDGSAAIGVQLNGDQVILPGSRVLFVLANGIGPVLQDTSSTAEFSVTQPGDYTIHTLIHDPATLDLSMLELGVTTAQELNSMMVQGGGAICAALDMFGTLITVQDCAPANDDCLNAEAMLVSLVGDCAQNTLNGDNTYATAAGGVPGCEVTSAFIADVWYTFNSGDNTAISVLFDPGTMGHWGLAVVDACDSGNELACVANPTAPIDLVTIPNTPYFVRVYSDREEGLGGTFSLCVTGANPSVVCDGGTVAASGGATVLDICQDGSPDVMDLINTSTSQQTYSYVLTDMEDVVVALIAGSSLDFNALPLGSYKVWGVSHNGALTGIAPGSAIAGIASEGACRELSLDQLMINVEICIGLGPRSQEAMRIFPNPTDGVLRLQAIDLDGLARIGVYDARGAAVIQTTVALVPGQELTLDKVAELAPGVYTLRLTSAAGLRTARFTVR